MYIDKSSVRRKDKTYTRYLLRTSYREDGTVKHKTIANLSHCSHEEIEAIRLALRHKDNLAELSTQVPSVEIKQGPSIGALLALKTAADEIGLTQILASKDSREGNLALWQIFSRVINQGSRLSAVRLAEQHAISPILGLDAFNEDDLYANLDWLADNQPDIEEALYEKLEKQEAQLFLYDVTSSYLEGEQNELAAFGYNRDKKKGKSQIVIGLLCNADGVSLCIRVFKGNTSDPKTIEDRIQEAAERFKIKHIVWIGDRGMIKKGQIEQLKERGFHYITAITKPQIETLIKEGIVQLSLFDTNLVEIEHEGVRYILRKNPVRIKEIEKQRASKLESVKVLVARQNEYISAHPKAKVETGLKIVETKIKKLSIDAWISVKANDRLIALEYDEEVKKEISQLDGCYVIKTDIQSHLVPKEIIHERYKDLALVEKAFRTCKTGHLELRPVYVRKESRTRGHVFVVMLAYRLTQVLEKYWKTVNVTIEEAINTLSLLCVSEISINKKISEFRLPEPTGLTSELIEAARIKIPQKMASITQAIHTKKSLKRNLKTKASFDLEKAIAKGGASTI